MDPAWLLMKSWRPVLHISNGKPHTQIWVVGLIHFKRAITRNVVLMSHWLDWDSEVLNGISTVKFLCCAEKGFLLNKHCHSLKMQHYVLPLICQVFYVHILSFHFIFAFLLSHCRILNTLLNQKCSPEEQPDLSVWMSLVFFEGLYFVLRSVI